MQWLLQLTLSRRAPTARCKRNPVAVAPLQGQTMALPHAHPLDIIDVHPLGIGLRDTVTASLIKTPPFN